MQSKDRCRAVKRLKLIQLLVWGTTTPMIKVVCFDLGGVLVQICRNWSEASTAAGFTDRDLAALAGVEAKARRAAVMDAYQRGALSCEQYRAAMSAALDGVYSPEEVSAVHDSWTLQEYPGVGALVDELNNVEGLLTACLSNTNHAHWERLSGVRTPLEYPTVAKLKCLLASHLLGFNKPEPEIYTHALRSFGCEAQQVLFFDDLEENIQAARQAGWHAELVDHAADTAAQMREHLRRYGVLRT